MKESFLNALSVVPSGVILCNSKDSSIIYANKETCDSIGVKETMDVTKSLLK